MKKTQSTSFGGIVFIIMAVLIWSLPFAVSPVFTGCSVFQGAEIDPAADPVIVHAQRTRGYALATFNAFLKFEYENRAAINNPQVKTAADTIRTNYKRWDDDLSRAIRAYQSVKSQENANKLDVALLVIQSGLEMASHYFLNDAIKAKAATKQ